MRHTHAPIAARLLVKLSANGKPLAQSPELVTPNLPISLATPWVQRGSAEYCAVLYNHALVRTDRGVALGYYEALRVCQRF
jgi:hypothetical protein